MAERGSMPHKAIPIYVIDDDKSVLRALLLLMQSAGFIARAFGSAKEFLESKDPGDPGVIIVDMRMPGMTGLELIEALAARKDRGKVIAISAFEDAPTRDLAKALGVVAFFKKPVDDQALIDTIEWAVRGENF